MSDVLFLILRRMRAPLIVLIALYAIAVFGLALTPGVRADGSREFMTLFHAFYVVSYTATTIGFGEIPNAFSDAQRMWMIVVIHLTVIGWTYTLGSIFTLVSDPTFRAAVARSMFAWRVRSTSEPFFILCGYGQSAALIARALDRLDYRVVVIELRAERAAQLVIADVASPIIALCADARFPDVLRDAGIERPQCAGLLALTSLDEVNQTIAIGAHTLRPNLQIIARTKSATVQTNLRALGGIQVVNPFDTFATNLALDLDAPDVLRLEEWLTDSPDALCPNRLGIPSGPWVIVGYGRFGRAIGRVLDVRGIDWRAVDHQKIDMESASGHQIVVDDDTSRALGGVDVAHAAVVVAGTDNDATNLAITTLARRVNPKVYTIIRQNHVADAVLIHAASANMRFVQAEIMVHECLQLIKVPLLASFLRHVARDGAGVASHVIDTIQQTLGHGSPRVWTFLCDGLQPGMFAAFFQSDGKALLLAHLQRDPFDAAAPLACVPLMLARGNQETLLPDAQTPLQIGDRILFVGDERATRLQRRFSRDPLVIDYVRSGVQQPRTWLFRKLRRRSATSMTTE
ncbi:MAG: NAD-binding protein [Burkholderiales bacterium]|nr:NAD-binding protein [Burkholderiales bacterium]